MRGRRVVSLPVDHGAIEVTVGRRLDGRGLANVRFAPHVGRSVTVAIHEDHLADVIVALSDAQTWLADAHHARAREGGE